ncbi:MAG: metallophosphoesterase [Alphaproteobacteria bacterium]|nr:metallophosphoesterase [Alphaproteobacteria bacterium]
MQDAVRRVEAPGPVAVIGDIHGEAGLLARLLERLPEDALVVCVGDLGDRGPDTRGVLDRLIERGAVGVLGNHDLWLRDWAVGRGFDRMALTPSMGGVTTLQSYGVKPGDIEAQAPRVPEHHRRWLAALPVALDLVVAGQPWWVIHAGVPLHVRFPPGIELAELVPWLAREAPEALLWPKTPPDMMIPVDRPVIMGHQPQPRPLDLGHLIAVDTGSGRGGALSALLLPERRFLTIR